MKYIYSRELKNNEECRNNIRRLLQEISEKPNGKIYVYDLIKQFAIKNNELYIKSNLLDLLNKDIPRRKR